MKKPSVSHGISALLISAWLAAPAGARAPVWQPYYPEQEITQLRTLPASAFPVVADKRHANLLPLIEKVAQEYGVNSQLMRAIIQVESNYQRDAVSPKGALGLMQVMPATGSRFGFTDLLDPETNLRAGAHYLRYLTAKYGNNTALILAAYNAGEGAVARFNNRVPPYPETTEYVARIMRDLQPLATEQPAPAVQQQAPSQPTEPTSHTTVYAVADVLNTVVDVMLSSGTTNK